jgi:hypothetical protein
MATGIFLLKKQSLLIVMNGQQERLAAMPSEENLMLCLRPDILSGEVFE